MKRVVRKLNYQKYFNTLLKLATLTLLLTSCIVSAPRDRSDGSSGISNTSDSVDEYYGRVLHDNPFALANNYNLSPLTNLSLYLKSDQDYITSSQFLEGNCDPNGSSGPGYISDCFIVKQDADADQLDPTDNKWAFDPSTPEFLEVNSYYHMQKQLDRWEKTLVNGLSTATSLFWVYKSALPTTMFTNNAHWKDTNSLKVYSSCDFADNGFYSSSDFQICLGYNSDYTNVSYAEDPTIIYHEFGHTFTDILMNVRNRNAGLTIESRLGYASYDEGGSINEGISDYYSYYMNGRTLFAEWALDSFGVAYTVKSQARPMSEDESMHADGISTNPDSRLSYPRYITYDPNQYDRNDGNDPQPFEDIHYAGQIASHYLVALTKDLMSECSMTQQNASSAVVHLIAETLAELGDLTATGVGLTSSATYNVNLNPDHASEWMKINRPINFRTFFQTFAKYLYEVYNQGSQCNGTSYSVDRIEQLLDEYGLLLFDNYNEDGNGYNGATETGHQGPHTAVNVSNRKYTTRISKDLIMLDPREGAYEAIVIDNRTTIQDAMESLQSSGMIGTLSTLIPADFHYNNSNNNISPGEVVGMALNLYNSSNYPMAGVQLLANDWDHVKDGKPCNTFEDAFPQSSEGAASADSSPLAPGDCSYITRSNGDDLDEIAPVCFVQISEDDATMWATQDELLDQMNGRTTADCLDPSDSKSCFVRAISGLDTAFYSIIDPQKTWSETLTYQGSGPSYNTNNLVFFEISPHILPGTVFNCRFRVRFTNCSDCWNDPTANTGDDFLDYEFSGADPYRIINFQFSVVN